MSRRGLVRAAVVVVLPRGLAAVPRLRVATFRCDVTPPPGEPLIWTTPLVKTEDPLWAKGIVLDDGRRRLVLCAMDWCGLGSSALRQFQEAMSDRQTSTVVHSVHQHAAPYVDGDAYGLLRALPDPPLCFSERGMREIAGRLSAAVKEALTRLTPVDAIGTGQAKVERAASARRVWDEGKLVVRYSTGGRDPRQAELPEGPIDPWLKTITFASGGRPLARLHYYATHPQTFCCDGRASADFVGHARERLEQEEGVFQVYFTGCGGDVTVGKYNDGSDQARRKLAERLYAGMRASAAATMFRSVQGLAWRTVPVRLPARTPQKEIEPGADPAVRYRTAISIAFARRKAPLELTGIELGGVRILHLPGEPMLEFQTFAQRSLPDQFVAVAGYGDVSSGYLCTDRAFEEGGYEPSASNVAPGGEKVLKGAIAEALGIVRD
jgi:hypothetical protein